MTPFNNSLLPQNATARRATGATAAPFKGRRCGATAEFRAASLRQHSSHRNDTLYQPVCVECCYFDCNGHSSSESLMLSLYALFLFIRITLKRRALKPRRGCT